MTYRWHTDDIMRMTYGWHSCRWHTDDIRMKYADNIRVKYRWFMDGILLTYGWHTDDTPIPYGWHTDGIRMAHGWHTCIYIETKYRNLIPHRINSSPHRAVDSVALSRVWFDQLSILGALCRLTWISRLLFITHLHNRLYMQSLHTQSACSSQLIAVASQKYVFQKDCILGVL